jgi:hypothetical protein
MSGGPDVRNMEYAGRRGPAKAPGGCRAGGAGVSADEIKTAAPRFKGAAAGAQESPMEKSGYRRRKAWICFMRVTA